MKNQTHASKFVAVHSREGIAGYIKLSPKFGWRVYAKTRKLIIHPSAPANLRRADAIEIVVDAWVLSAF